VSRVLVVERHAGRRPGEGLRSVKPRLIQESRAGIREILVVGDNRKSSVGENLTVQLLDGIGSVLAVEVFDRVTLRYIKYSEL
jgi:hypothetical protein